MKKKITYPLRVGRKQNRVIVDAAGLQVAEVSPAFPELAHEFVGYMNGKGNEITEGGERLYQQWKVQYSGFKKDSENSALKRQVREYKEEMNCAHEDRIKAWEDRDRIIKERNALKVENGELMEMYNMASLKNEELIRKNKELTEARDYLAKEVQEANADRSYEEQQKRELHEKITALENENFELKCTLDNAYTLNGGVVAPLSTKWTLRGFTKKDDDLGEITRKHDYRIKVLEAIVWTSLTIGAIYLVAWVSKTFA